MIENQIISVQFGQPGKPVSPMPDVGDQFGLPQAIGRNQPTSLLQREAALLLAEQGWPLARIAAHMKTTALEVARILLRDGWTWRGPEDSAEQGLQIVADGRHVPFIRSRQTQQLLQKINQGHICRISNSFLREHRRRLKSLQEQGFLVLTAQNHLHEIRLTARGEAMALLLGEARA
ncbi:MAG: hypothetical protein P1V21_01305 [Rhizobiaceae bacterium]|nr:hypothetical protein [Rhizobiaceae bacterium]